MSLIRLLIIFMAAWLGAMMDDIKAKDIEADADKDSEASRLFAMKKRHVEIEEEVKEEKRKKKFKGPKIQKHKGMF